MTLLVRLESPPQTLRNASECQNSRRHLRSRTRPAGFDAESQWPHPGVQASTHDQPTTSDTRETATSEGVNTT